jgi:chromosome segregation ATPase
MNENRRKQIRSLSADLDKIKNEVDATEETASLEESGEDDSKDELADKEENWTSRVDDIRSSLEDLKGEEEEYYENMPEGLQGGDKGSASQEATEAMGRADEILEELVNCEEVGEFVKTLLDKYDDLSTYLEEASA